MSASGPWFQTHRKKSTGNLKKRIKINIKYTTHAFELLFFFYLSKFEIVWVHVWSFLSELFTFFLRLFVFNCRWTNKEPNYVSSINEAAQLNQKRCPHRTLHIDMVKQMIYLVICSKLVELKHKFHILSDKFIRKQEANDTHAIQLLIKKFWSV